MEAGGEARKIKRSLFSELKQRHVIQTVAAYTVLGWILLQVADVVIPAVALPDRSMTVVVWAYFLGFFPVIVLSWYFELTPQGLQRDLRRLTTGHRQQSIAVLPFVNMSDDPQNEYFSDGLSEELLNLLTKIPELRVTARTSSFSYKDKNATVSRIADELNVAHVLEGSVRKSGNRVRITAQLIDARRDVHLLSETYDRELDDIFAIQDEIAAEVVDALKVRLLGEVPKTRETQPECYALYLQGRHFADLNTESGYKKAEDLLKKSLDIAPEYAPAWNVLGEVYARRTNFVPLSIDEGNVKARAAVEKALSLDPQLAAAYATMAWIALYYDRDFQAAATHLQQAHSLDPCDARTLRWATLLLSILGRTDEAIAVGEEIVSRDPVNPVGYFNLGMYYYIAARLDQAQKMYEQHLAMGGSSDGGQFSIAKVLLAKGDPAAALAAARRETDAGWRLEGIALACHDLGNANESDAALAELIDKFAADMSYNIAEANAYMGNIDAAFEWLQTAYENRDGGLTEVKREPLMRNLHTDPRWSGLLTKLGLGDEQLATIEFSIELPDCVRAEPS